MVGGVSVPDRLVGGARQLNRSSGRRHRRHIPAAAARRRGKECEVPDVDVQEDTVELIRIQALLEDCHLDLSGEFAVANMLMARAESRVRLQWCSTVRRRWPRPGRFAMTVGRAARGRR